MNVVTSIINNTPVISELHLTRDDFVIHASEEMVEDGDYRLLVRTTRILFPDDLVSVLQEELGDSRKVRSLLGQFPDEKPLSGDVLLKEQSSGPLMIGKASLSEEDFQARIDSLHEHFEFMNERFMGANIAEQVDRIQFKLVMMNSDLIKELRDSDQLIENLDTTTRNEYIAARDRIAKAEAALREAQEDYSEVVVDVMSNRAGSKAIPAGLYKQALQMLCFDHIGSPERYFHAGSIVNAMIKKTVNEN